MNHKRKRYSAELESKVALAAPRNEKMVSELTSRFGDHPTMLNDGAAGILDKLQKSLKDLGSTLDELF
jgi:hypothetical protein